MRPIRAMRAVAILVLAPGLLWLGGLVWFVETLPRTAPPLPSADAAVVLTGGSGRIAAGLRLLRDGHVGRLFVSGADQRVGLAALLASGGAQAQTVGCCVEIGHEAGDTRGNAIESARWANARGYRTIILVTANYHMPRSLLEFGALMPGAELIPFPIQPAHVKLDRWWLWPGTARLLISEYDKLLVARARRAVSRGLPGGEAEAAHSAPQAIP